MIRLVILREDIHYNIGDIVIVGEAKEFGSVIRTVVGYRKDFDGDMIYIVVCKRGLKSEHYGYMLTHLPEYNKHPDYCGCCER